MNTMPITPYIATHLTSAVPSTAPADPIKNNNPNYTYKITKGVSDVKGGVSVLKQLNYPNNIIESTMNVLEKM